MPSSTNGHTNGHAPATHKASTRPTLKPNGALDSFKTFEVTPAIGQEFPDVQIKDIISAPNSDELLQEFARVISTRGVVFFRSQDLTLAQQKEFTRRIGILSGKPSTSGLHIPATFNAGQDIVVDAEAQKDPEIFIVSNRLAKKMYDRSTLDADAAKNRNASRGWHTDIMFENVPSDYACLKMHTLPPSGGDTLWASGYEMFDRFSTHYQKFLSGLTVTSSQQTFTSAAKKGGYELIKENRGTPENFGEHFTATHPVVRTNPVTGRNSIYALGLHAKSIDGLTNMESDNMMKIFLDLITQNHDIQVRFRWTMNDVAIWDNRCVYHTGTADFNDDHPRAGVRVTSCGERPYFDPATLA